MRASFRGVILPKPVPAGHSASREGSGGRIVARSLTRTVNLSRKITFFVWHSASLLAGGYQRPPLVKQFRQFAFLHHLILSHNLLVAVAAKPTCGVVASPCVSAPAAALPARKRSALVELADLHWHCCSFRVVAVVPHARIVSNRIQDVQPFSFSGFSRSFQRPLAGRSSARRS